MNKFHADQQAFRAWLVKHLTELRWSAPIGLPLPDLAVRLGVQEDVLREAQALRAAELGRRGKAGIAHGRRRYVAHDFAIVQLEVPLVLKQIWLECCGIMRLEPGALFRSLLHRFLLKPERPQYIGTGWMFKGKRYVTVRAKRECSQIVTRITRGAQVALDTLADNWDTTPTALARGVVTEFLEGRTQKLKIVTFRQLWGDPDRYLHPEKFAS
jgi:hypothetical protein